MSYDKDKIKNNLTLEQVFSLLEEFGANPTLQGESILCDTICHNIVGEGSRKLYYYNNTKLLKCYTDCGEYFDIFQLVVKIFDMQYGETWELPKAIAYIANKFGFQSLEENGFEDKVSEDWAYFKSLERLTLRQEKQRKIIELKEYDEKILKCMAQVRIQPWINEGITRDTMRRYEISYYPKECQIVIPHRDSDGKLVGVRGRTLVKEEGEAFGKYRPLKANGEMYNHPLGFNLYGLDKNKDNISAIKKAIIFEGEKSVMLYDSYFGKENNISVASCGSSITQHQFELLQKLGVQEIIIAFDKQFKEKGDREFKKLVKNLQNLANKFKNYVTVSCIFDKQDLLDYKSSPIDHGSEVFMELFKSRILL